LFVAEEDLGEGNGRLSQIAANGIPTVICTGLGTIEDVVVDDSGRLFVSEDMSGNGRVILLERGNLYQLYLPVILNP
jgi:hypothetical protein